MCNPTCFADLQRIAEFFPQAGFEFQIDPAYEPTHATADPEKNAVFRDPPKIQPSQSADTSWAPHPWHAAIESKLWKLTALGEHYRRLAAKGLI